MERVGQSVNNQLALLNRICVVFFRKYDFLEKLHQIRKNAWANHQRLHIVLQKAQPIYLSGQQAPVNCLKAQYLVRIECIYHPIYKYIYASI